MSAGCDHASHIDHALVLSVVRSNESLGPKPVPVDDLPETDEERHLVDAARAQYARTGKGFSQVEVEALIAERKRREFSR